MANQTITPEMAIYGAGCRLIESYLGPRTLVSAQKVGTRVVISIVGLPVYGRDTATTIQVSVPAGNVRVNGNSFRLANPIGSNDISYRIAGGGEFPHPHIYSDGSACMNGGRISSLVELFAMITDTVTWNNVTEDSERIGHFILNNTVASMGNNRRRCINQFKSRMARTVKQRDQKTTEYMVERYPRVAIQVLEALR